MDAHIKAENLSFHYTDEDGKTTSPEILRDLSLTIDSGAFVAVLGHNGCGKSTLAKHMNAILLPTGGSVTVCGMDTKQEEKLYEIRQHIGMVFSKSGQPNCCDDCGRGRGVWTGKPRAATRGNPSQSG